MSRQTAERPTVEGVRELAIATDALIAEAVARWDVKVGEDWRGAPAVFIVVVFRDDAIRRVWPVHDAFRRKLLDELYERLPDDYIAYLTFSAESEALDPDRP